MKKVSDCPLDGRVWLSDRGINQAIQAGLIQHIETYPQGDEVYTGQIRPCTIDLRAAQPVEIGPYQLRKLIHYPLRAEGFELVGEARSRVRRHQLRVLGYSSSEQSLLVANHIHQTFFLGEGDRFCQVFVGGSPESQAREFDHGQPITSYEDMKRLISDNHLKEREGRELEVNEQGYLVLHASDRIATMDNIIATMDNINLFGRVSIVRDPPPRLPTVHLNGSPVPAISPFSVVVRESVELSSHVALLISFLQEEGSQMGGVVDPGYKGDLFYNPLARSARVISPGEPVAVARAVYFKNPVLIPYGDRRRESSFQGTSLG